MIYDKNMNGVRIVAILLLSALCACSGGSSDRHAEKKQRKEEKKMAKEKKQKPAEDGGGGKSTNSSMKGASTADASQFAATGCDASLWNHVYDPTRLQQVTPCVSVSGTVQESAADDDGDQHFLLKLDPGQEALVNKKNQKQKGGALVVEIVCANPITLQKAKAACAGYTNRIPKPQVGSHVKATGTYVIDTHNGWAEVHPVSTLQKM
ncbi:MAG: hypothetical protein M3Z54_13705 [Gemmatimonadota bacterium]|nr:hypothetical protein [Gemmatimonadota bacterium]